MLRNNVISRTASIMSSRAMKCSLTALLVLASLVWPALVSAAQVSQRSISLSSSSINATNVTYQVNFTAIDAADAFVIDFCSNSPTVGQTCTVPQGFDVSAVVSQTSGFTQTSALDANTLVVTGNLTVGGSVAVALEGVTNPSTPGSLYARVITYDSAVNAGAYISEDVGMGSIDEGGFAMAITDTVGVSGAVLESLTFCLSGSAIAADCSNVTPPSIQLGTAVGSATVLSPDIVSTGVVYAQLSTNAASGVIVRLTSAARDCGGLTRLGAPGACDIAPALQGGIVAGQAKFGVKAGIASDTGPSPSGVLQPVAGSGYGADAFALNYAVGSATGVTSPFGDPFLDTSGAAVNNKNIPLTFGASVSNTTPAGLYWTDVGLIAAGRF